LRFCSITRVPVGEHHLLLQCLRRMCITSVRQGVRDVADSE
jgi:hypothetical protein